MVLHIDKHKQEIYLNLKDIINGYDIDDKLWAAIWLSATCKTPTAGAVRTIFAWMHNIDKPKER